MIEMFLCNVLLRELCVSQLRKGHLHFWTEKSRSKMLNMTLFILGKLHENFVLLFAFKCEHNYMLKVIIHDETVPYCIRKGRV